MLKKVISISNLGKFKNYSATGDMDLRAVNLIYAENGQGKTTLSTVFRSLSENNPNLLIGRKSLGEAGDISVQLRFESHNIQFSNSVWSENYRNLEVFDAKFISENIYVGTSVESENKRSLYKFVVGHDGVDLAHAVDRLDNEIRAVNTNISPIEKELKKIIRSGITVEKFLEIPVEELEKINQELLARNLDFDAHKKSDEILRKPSLKFINVQAVNKEKVVELLSEKMTDLSKDAVQKVKAKIASLPDNSQNWLSQGTLLVKERSCPFCDQSIADNELVIAYKMFFSERYQQLQRSFLVLNNIFKIVEHPEVSAQTNGLLGDYWKNFFKIDMPDHAIANSIYKKIEKTQELVSFLVQVRNENLELDLASDERLKSVYSLLEEFEHEIELYNNKIKILNDEIDSFKIKLQGGDAKKLQQEILRLEDVKSRSEPETQALCLSLKALKEQKIRLEQEKIQKRSQLDTYTTEIFPKYQSLINQLLEKFGSTFSITGTSSSHMGGKPSASYKLVINNTPFDLGDITTPENVPSFRNTLSEGEKSTLAFCYFLARLSLDANISNKIVLLDDPLSSFDSFRRDLTKQEIKRLSTKAKQIIILSHDQYFLKLIWDDMRSSKPLWINRLSNGSTIANWDIESTTQSSYFKDCAKLHKFLEEGSNSESEMRDIVRAIRPVLEHNLRVRFPSTFNVSGLWLGNFLDMINTAEDGNPIFICKPQYNDLDDINSFSKKYHHSENANADSEPISSATLSLYVKKTLKAVAGIVTTGISN